MTMNVQVLKGNMYECVQYINKLKKISEILLIYSRIAIVSRYNYVRYNLLSHTITYYNYKELRVVDGNDGIGLSYPAVVRCNVRK